MQSNDKVKLIIEFASYSENTSGRYKYNKYNKIIII